MILHLERSRIRTTSTEKQNAQAPDILLRHRRVLPHGPHRLVHSPRPPSRLHSDGQLAKYGHVHSRIVRDSPVRSQPRGNHAQRTYSSCCSSRWPVGARFQICIRSIASQAIPSIQRDPDATRAQGLSFSAHHPRSRRCNPAGLFGVRWG